MADKELEIAGVMRVFPEVGTAANGRTLHAEGVSLAGGALSGIAGTEVANDRLRFEFKPVDADSVLEILQDAVVAVGNGAQSDLKGYARAHLDIRIATTATVTFELSIDDGTTFYSVGLAAIATGTVATSATASGLFYFPPMVAGGTFRARVSAWTSGAVSALLRKHPR
jgi:hypothetical protein